ncbi:predicted protein [Botrytis cinerea T4]|uniref:Uncharacterized protein n=1 Tax=Botryotinia fuckeliana (strain T4) TaxID=999810 RepID=G2YAX6_BOTF4|nr:predicted protein [Botrytis cinerea T4]
MFHRKQLAKRNEIKETTVTGAPNKLHLSQMGLDFR